MTPEGSRKDGKRRSMLGVAAYLLVPGERRRRAAGHFSRAAIEAARGVRTLYVPSGSGARREDGDEREAPGGQRARQNIRID
jgi:hypothetical protein